MSDLWLTEDEADTYFATRLGASEFWASGTAKAAALRTAQDQIEACPDFTFTALSSGEVAADAQMNAVCEQALFLLIHGSGIDRRQGLQAQGVTQAGIVQETYKAGVGDEIALAPIARAMLTDYRSTTDGQFDWLK